VVGRTGAAGLVTHLGTSAGCSVSACSRRVQARGYTVRITLQGQGRGYQLRRHPHHLVTRVEHLPCEPQPQVVAVLVWRLDGVDEIRRRTGGFPSRR
jgi:hypothetical protein